jgi:glycosyltransferase involved in cell wall biosynthesis
MRIVFLCTSGLDNASPRGRWLPVARELAAMGHEPHLLLLHPAFDHMPDSERDFPVGGVRVAHLAQMHAYGLPGERRYFDPAELARVAWHASRALQAEAVRLAPDVLHICKPQPINGFAGWRASRRLRRPFYVDCDDYEAGANRTSNAAQRAIIRWWEDALPRRAAGVTVNTRFLQARCQAHGVASVRITYVPNGADRPALLDEPARCLPAEVLELRGQPVVAYIGTMSMVAHGVDLLLEAFVLVVAKLPQARLLMVGDGDDRAALRARAQTLGIAPKVCWVGRVAADRVPCLLTVATCTIDPVYDTPATRGRSPLKIVESLAAGVPVVTGDVGDRRETLGDGAAGVLVAPGDAAALAGGMLALLTQAELRRFTAEGALRQSERYRWRALAERWVEAYHRPRSAA